MQNATYYILSAIAALIALTVHEYCHGYAAYKLGDNTAKDMGRLTLNPLKHLDPYGVLCMVLFHFGWAKPVPINARNFKEPKKGFAIVAAAGPAVNLILGFVFALFYLLFKKFANHALISGAITNDFQFNLFNNTLNFLYIFHAINVGFALFNLLPIPPFDGSRLLYVFLPPKYYFGIMKYERKIHLAVLGWLLLGDYVAYAVRMIPIVKAIPALNWLAGIFSLSDMVSTVITGASDLMIKFWSMII